MPRAMLLSVVAVVLLAIAGPAFAGAGLHLGFTDDPDDFLIGFHFQSHPVADHLRLVPSVEAGFGDVTMIAGNADFHYMFPASSGTRPYLGGGVTVNWFDVNQGSQTDLGGSVLGGIEFSRSYAVEMKIGLGDVPDLKAAFLFNR